MKTLNEQLDRIKSMMGLINEVEVSIDYLYDKKYNDIPRNIFDEILDADPKFNGKQPSNYTQWMVNLYRRKSLKSEDIYKVKEYLPLLIKYKNKLDIKDINQIKSVQELYSIVSKFADNPEEHQSNSSLEREIKKDARKVYEDDEWTVIVPETKEASCYYGKGTQWCTAATKNNYEKNMFDNYYRYGDLYININKKTGRKYQMNFPDGDSGETIQIRDESDSAIEGNVIRIIDMTEGLVNFYVETIGWVVKIVFEDFYEDMRFPEPNYDGFYEFGQYWYTPDNGELVDYYNLGNNYSVEKGYVCYESHAFAVCPISYESPKELGEMDLRFVDRGEKYMVMNKEGGNPFVSDVDTGEIIKDLKPIEYSFDGELIRRGNDIINLDDEVEFTLPGPWAKFQVKAVKFVGGGSYVQISFSGNQRVYFNTETGEQENICPLDNKLFAINGYAVNLNKNEKVFKLPSTYDPDFSRFFDAGNYYKLDNKFYNREGEEVSQDEVRNSRK